MGRISRTVTAVFLLSVSVPGCVVSAAPLSSSDHDSIRQQQSEQTQRDEPENSSAVLRLSLMHRQPRPVPAFLFVIFR